MTKTEARKLARRARQYGYFRQGGSHSYVFCPLCRATVGTDHYAWLSVAEIGRALDAAVIEHLTEGCDA